MSNEATIDPTRASYPPEIERALSAVESCRLSQASMATMQKDLADLKTSVADGVQGIQRIASVGERMVPNTIKTWLLLGGFVLFAISANFLFPVVFVVVLLGKASEIRALVGM